MGAVPSYFMMDGETYTCGGEIGFQGMDFYFAGRGGVLGDVSGAVVAAALVFFEPSTVTAAWDRARIVADPARAADAFAGCAAGWALAHLPDGPDYGRLAELEGRIVSSASCAGAPLFAGWRALPEPQEPKALALHRLNSLRELRGAMHGAAVLAEGLHPLEAVVVRSPHMVQLFGWGDVELPDPERHRQAWERAEAGTDRAMARHLAVLGDAERAEFVELLRALSPT
jgi:hypothetical protein